MAKLLNGFYYPFGAPLGMPFADVDDVAAAHCLALAVPEADGRCRFWEALILFQTPLVMSARMSFVCCAFIEPSKSLADLSTG